MKIYSATFLVAKLCFTGGVYFETVTLPKPVVNENKIIAFSDISFSDARILAVKLHKNKSADSKTISKSVSNHC